MAMVMIAHPGKVTDPRLPILFKFRPWFKKAKVLRRSWIRMGIDDRELFWQLYGELRVETIRVYVEKRD